MVATTTFKDILFPVPWGHVACRWYGNRQVRPILAIHGWLDNMGVWETLIPLLPEHIGILCLDLPGHGQSSKYPRGVLYHSIDYITIIMRIVKAFQWQKVSLMGHSMGSMLSFIYASIFPHKVDIVIALDLIKPKYDSTEEQITRWVEMIEKALAYDNFTQTLQEPPSSTLAQLERKLYEGWGHSVELVNCKYLLNRMVVNSAKFADKYYFSYDPRANYNDQFSPPPEHAAEFAKRICNVPYFVLKAKDSMYINEDSNEVISILRKNNPDFEMHVIEGTHHVHLNNPKAVAELLIPFLNRHLPPTLGTGTLAVEETFIQSKL